MAIEGLFLVTKAVFMRLVAFHKRLLLIIIRRKDWWILVELNMSKEYIIWIYQYCNIICFSIITRTIFVYVLGAEYLGVSGLFSNVLGVLSFTELGIGSAIVFRYISQLRKMIMKK